MKYKYIATVQFFCLSSMSINGWLTPIARTWHNFLVHNVWWMAMYWVFIGIISYFSYKKEKKAEAEFQRQMLEFQLEHAKRIKEWKNQYNQMPM